MRSSGSEGVKGSEAVRIWLLGGFRVSVGSRTIEDKQWRLKKAAALVKLLALLPAHRLHREQAMDLLWPDSGRRAASNNLRQTLHAARNALDPTAGSRYLASQDESLVLCPGGDLWVDVETFQQSAASARRSREPAAYRAALDLYAGELLPTDRYEEWAEEHRRRLQETYLSLLLGLAGLHEERGEYEVAIEALRTVLSEEPTREEAHAGLMRVYALMGIKGEALVQYERLEQAFSRELGTEPAASSRALKEEIAAGRFPSEEARPTGSPPEEPLGAGKQNLPAARTSFVGREREMVEVKRELAMTRLLTLTGVGGSGKTRLALEVARDLVGAYSDGVWLVELAGLTEGELVPQAVAKVLGVREQPGQPLAGTLAEALRSKEVLLVLDNCEHLVDAAAHLVDVLLDSCPHLRILVTSREVLGVTGEVRWLVPSLSVPDVQRLPTVRELEAYESVRLFAERARQVNSTFALTPGNAKAVAEICRRLEGLPLAIELAAARTNLLTPQAMLSRLGSRLKLLTGGARDLPKRQRTLRAAIEWSYELLDEGEKTLFARLSVFSGGRTLEAIEAVCDAEGDLPIDVLEGVSSLLEKNLIGQEEESDGEPRFVMLETIHEYARERLDERGEAEEVKKRHFEYFLALAEEAEPELIGRQQLEWIEVLEAEHDNMRAALAWATERGETELGLRLAGALGEFWYARGHYGEGKRWLERALAKDGGTAPAAARAKALEAVGWLAIERGEIEEAEIAAEEGLALSVQTGIESTRRASFLRMLGTMARIRGDNERAKELYEESLSLSREAGDRWGIANSLATLGSVAFMRGDHEQGKELYEEGLILSRELGGAQPLADFLISMGYTLLLEGDHERATALNEEAAALLREQRHRGDLQYAVDNLGWAALVRGDHERARQLFEESLRLCLELGDRTIAAESLEGLACVAEAEGEAERATRLFGVAEALREAVGYHQTSTERALREPYLATARSRMEEESWAEGRAMTLEEAIEYALSEVEPVGSAFPMPEQEAPASAQSPNLTRREREVAALIARGLTSRQIAEELVVSKYTVDNHVRNILKKLGLGSRDQIAARLNEHR
jgi:predicted ATPase/DNA-binding SARP family transcriptional activator/DNA-binding CsgD family transcriptional regulator